MGQICWYNENGKVKSGCNLVPGGCAGEDERMKTKVKEAKGTGDPAEHGRGTAEMTD